jgi:hypothetical protein
LNSLYRSNLGRVPAALKARELAQPPFRVLSSPLVASPYLMLSTLNAL